MFLCFNNKQYNSVLPIISLIVLFAVLSNSQICGISQYFNGQHCAPCQSNCKCTSEYGCDSCISGYTFDKTFTQCLQCPTQASALADGLSSYSIGCKQCCNQISGTQFVCSECDDSNGANPFVYLKGGQCYKMNGCLNMTKNGICQSCQNIGYYKYESVCLACDVSCQTCVDSTYCLTCASKYYFKLSDQNFALCTICPTGCSACVSNTQCSSCLSAYVLNTGTNMCDACSVGCTKCTSTGICSICAPSYGLIASSCKLCTDVGFGGSAGCTQCDGASGALRCNRCSLGYALISNVCILCSARYPNSLYCDQTKPIQCLNDNVATLQNRFYLYNNQCISNINRCKMINSSFGACSQCYFSQVNSVFYRISGITCLQCSVTGCLTYNTNCTCKTCQLGYQFINNQCNQCNNLHCLKCLGNVNSCTQCASGYGIFSTTCALCLKSNCINCDGDFSVCAICAQGFYLDQNSGSCFQCQSSCVTCTSQRKCETCAGGYFLTEDYRCKRLPSKCLQVYNQNSTVILASGSTTYSAGSCKKCTYGFQVGFNNCYPCGLSLFNMDSCEKFCPSYYLQQGIFGERLSILWQMLITILIIQVFL